LNGRRASRSTTCRSARWTSTSIRSKTNIDDIELAIADEGYTGFVAD